MKGTIESPAVKAGEAPITTAAEALAYPEPGDDRRDDAGEDLGPDDPADEWEDDPTEYDSLDDWPAWTEGYDLETSDPADARLNLGDLIAFEVDRFRAMGSDAGDLMAEALAELLAEVEITHARDASTLRDRRDALADMRAREAMPL